MTNEEAQLIDIKFQLDMYGSGQGSAEDALARVREIIFSPSLTDDQQVVLEWLKERFERKDELTEILWELVDGTLADECYSIYGQAWKRLSKAEQFQVLAAFAEWGNKSNE